MPGLGDRGDEARGRENGAQGLARGGEERRGEECDREDAADRPAESVGKGLRTLVSQDERWRGRQKEDVPLTGYIEGGAVNAGWVEKDVGQSCDTRAVGKMPCAVNPRKLLRAVNDCVRYDRRYGHVDAPGHVEPNRVPERRGFKVAHLELVNRAFTGEVDVSHLIPVA